MKKNKKGFTLVELMIVIAIIAILAAVSIVGYRTFIKKADKSNAEQEAAQAREDLIGQTIVNGGEYKVTHKDGTTTFTYSQGQLHYSTDPTNKNDKTFKEQVDDLKQLDGDFEFRDNEGYYDSGDKKTDIDSGNTDYKTGDIEIKDEHGNVITPDIEGKTDKEIEEIVKNSILNYFMSGDTITIVCHKKSLYIVLKALDTVSDIVSDIPVLGYLIDQGKCRLNPIFCYNITVVANY